MSPLKAVGCPWVKKRGGGSNWNADRADSLAMAWYVLCVQPPADRADSVHNGMVFVASPDSMADSVHCT